MDLRFKKIIKGNISGRILFSYSPINFLTSVNVKSGEVCDKSHELHGYCLKDTILIFPNSIGSSVGAYSIFALKKNKVSPLAMVCTRKTDITTASGCAIADIPLVELIDKIDHIWSGWCGNGTLNWEKCILQIKTD